MWTSKTRASPLFGVLTFQDCRPHRSTLRVFDPLRDEAKAYAEALERAGAKVRYICHEHMIHHFYAMGGAIPYAKTALKSAGADIKAALAAVELLT